MHLAIRNLRGEIMIELKKNEEELTKEVMDKINLSKDKVNLEKHVVSLSKTVVDLSKRNGVDLGSTSAKVVVVLDYTRGKGVEIYEEQFGRKASGACGRVVGTEPAADTDADILWF